MTRKQIANLAETGGANIAESNTKKAATKATIPSVLLLISIFICYLLRTFNSRQQASANLFCS